MPRENVSEKEIIELAEEFASRFPHLSKRRHYKIVRAGYGNWIGKEYFRTWYEKTIPLIKPEMVAISKEIHALLQHDSFYVCELGVKPLREILKEAA